MLLFHRVGRSCSAYLPWIPFLPSAFSGQVASSPPCDSGQTMIGSKLVLVITFPLVRSWFGNECRIPSSGHEPCLGTSEDGSLTDKQRHPTGRDPFPHPRSLSWTSSGGDFLNYCSQPVAHLPRAPLTDGSKADRRAQEQVYVCTSGYRSL